MEDKNKNPEIIVTKVEKLERNLEKDRILSYKKNFAIDLDQLSNDDDNQNFVELMVALHSAKSLKSQSCSSPL